MAVKKICYFVKLNNYYFEKIFIDKNKNLNLDYFELNKTLKIFNWRQCHAKRYPMEKVSDIFFIHAWNIIKKVIYIY